MILSSINGWRMEDGQNRGGQNKIFEKAVADVVPLPPLFYAICTRELDIRSTLYSGKLRRINFVQPRRRFRKPRHRDLDASWKCNFWELSPLFHEASRKPIIEGSIYHPVRTLSQSYLETPPRRYFRHKAFFQPKFTR